MGKLGKKARKFAKKNLQSVLKVRRKNKALMKKRYSSSSNSKVRKVTVETHGDNTKVLENGRVPESEELLDVSLDELFPEDAYDMDEHGSDSDGFLSEELSDPSDADSPDDTDSDDNTIDGLSSPNRKINKELAVQKKKLNKLKKDPEFSEFLTTYQKAMEKYQDEEMNSDEDEAVYHSTEIVDEDSLPTNKGKRLTTSVIDSWCQLVKEDHKSPALKSLVNAYRAACHYEAESSSDSDDVPWKTIQNSEAFCRILMFMLGEADNIFRDLLKIPSSCFKKEVVLELKNTSKWKRLRPLVKSYLRSTLFLLNQVTDSEILAFALRRLRVSIIFFVAFPSLLNRLLKVAVHLWATGEGVLPSSSFFIIRDVAVIFSSEYYDICLMKTYKAYLGLGKGVQFVSTQHVRFLKESLLELCSLDVHKSCSKAILSIQQLAKIFKKGLQTKKKAALKKICNWQYVNCIDLWVFFISANIKDYNLNLMLYPIIQLIKGVAFLYAGPRYFPLRLKCVQWLNHLSSSSGIFIPVVSLVLDVLEYKIGKKSEKPGKAFNFSSVLKLPKHWLKSRNFQEECVLFVIEQLCSHLGHWSYHVSFPEIATIPLIRLRKFDDLNVNESLKRPVKRLIDQVEQNVEFVRKKRDEVAFSPKDHQQVDSFLQMEKQNANAPFTQYYRSVMEKAMARYLDTGFKRSSLKKKAKGKRGQKAQEIQN